MVGDIIVDLEREEMEEFQANSAQSITTTTDFAFLLMAPFG
jgi:hypothetical protein